MIPPEQRAEIRRLYYAEHCDARAADLLFEVVSRRYERRSLVLTTNLPFSEWPSIFPNAATATALHRSRRAPRRDHHDRG